MALEAYSACPCGSGKKFKWCCQPIHVEIDKAFQQEAAGQTEVALRTMDQVTIDHPANPEAWGRKAELLYNAGRLEEAEAALQKALDINPKYPFGFLLRGLFRRTEGEIAGAVLSFRKAAEVYDPEAKDLLAHVYALIFDSEMKLNRPLAARAAAQLALRFQPADQQLQQGMQAVFGPENPNLPQVAKTEHRYMPLPASASDAQKTAWNAGLAQAGTGKLQDAAKAFDDLTRASPDDAPAWYNLALTQAWLGDNKSALESLEKYVALEKDEGRAGEAWLLAEVLRMGQGMEDFADIVEYSVVAPLANPQAFVEVLGKLEEEGTLTGVRVDKEHGVLTGVLMEKPAPALTPELEAKQAPRVGAYLAFMGDVIRLWNTAREALDRTVTIVKERAGKLLGEVYPTRGPGKFFDVISDSLLFPKVATEKEIEPALRAHLQKHFEETWIHQPRKSLDGVPPVDAAGSSLLRKKLRGVVTFIEQCAALAKVPYDFERLRRKLGLVEGESGKAQESSAGPDFGAMAASELAGITIDSLSDTELDQAFIAALKLDARELAGKFAHALVGRPVRADKPDRYPLYNHLVNVAVAQGDTAEALNHLNEGEKDDCEHNEGRRRNDYEVRRGQLLAKSGDMEQAKDIFDRLIARVPGELKIRGTAAEAMLAAKQPARALAYAEGGLAEARKQNHRDSEEYFLELSGAAKKQGA